MIQRLVSVELLTKAIAFLQQSSEEAERLRQELYHAAFTPVQPAAPSATAGRDRRQPDAPADRRVPVRHAAEPPLLQTLEHTVRASLGGPRVVDPADLARQLFDHACEHFELANESAIDVLAGKPPRQP